MTAATDAPTDGNVPEWSLGDRLAKARATAGLTQDAMAEHFGVSHSTIGKWETDTSQPRRFYDRMTQWSAITGVSLEWLLGFRTGSFSRHLKAVPPVEGQLEFAFIEPILLLSCE